MPQPENEERLVNPFPGLRPFEPHEAYLFFGREGQSDELLRILARNRFLAVVGTSGSGKSSLVRAGMLPALQRGFMTNAGSNWRIAIMRPGANPIENLATALNNSAPLKPNGPSKEARQFLIDTALSSDSMGLVECARIGSTDTRENVLVLIDQFEEVFRMRSEGDESRRKIEPAEFVRLLLEAIGRDEVPVYVVITMRSDFLGDCAQFRDLPETLNRAQYLVPRMTRDQLRQAIESPIAVGGATISPLLVQRLLNDVGDDPDQLPIMQHALMRTWEAWQQTGGSGAIDLEHYESIGGMTHALSRHADEAFGELDEDGCRIARRVFQRLSEKGMDNRETRRPTKLKELCAVSEADQAAVVSVIDRFRTRGRTFLTPPVSERLTAESTIDISHESLIRLWVKLRDWVEVEAEWAALYQRLAGAVVRSEAPWRDPGLQLALNWRKEAQPTQAWAARYTPGFTTFTSAMNFLERSRLERETSKWRRRFIGLVFIVLGLASFVSGVYANHKRNEAFARQLGYQALSNVEKEPEQSALLAAESLKIFPMLETDRALRKTMELLAKPAWLNRYDGNVYSVSFSGDGRYLATGSSDKTARVLDVKTGKEVSRLVHEAVVDTVAFSPDARFVATGSRDKTARVFEVATGKEVSRLVHEGPVDMVVFSPDGRYVATASWDRTARVFEAASGKEVSRLVHGGIVDAVAFSSNGNDVATASWDHTARVFEAATGKEVSQHRCGDIADAVAFSRDGLVATGSLDGTATIFKAADGSVLMTLPLSSSVEAVAFSPNGEFLATGSWDYTARVFEVATGKQVSRLDHEATVDKVTFSPDGRTVASASRDGTVRVFDAQTGAEISRLIHGASVYAVSFSPNGGEVATGSSDFARLFKVERGDANDNGKGALSEDGSSEAMSSPGFVRVLERDTRKESSRVPYRGDVRAITFSPDAKYFAVLNRQGEAEVFSKSSHERIFVAPKDSLVRALAISADARHVAIGCQDGIASVFDMASGMPLSRPLQHEGSVDAVAFSPNGRYLATGSWDSNARVFDSLSGQRLWVHAHQGGVLALAFSGDGRYLATGSDDNTARVLDAATGKEVSRIVPEKAAISAVAFSRDDRDVAAVTDGEVLVFETDSGAIKLRLPQRGDVVGMAFSRDENFLYTLVKSKTTSDLAVRKNSLRPDELIEEACSRLTRNLSDDEWKEFGLTGRPQKTCPDLP